MAGTRTQQYAKNFTATLISFVGTAIYSIVWRKMFISMLGVEYLGIGSLLGNVLGMLSLTELGIGTSIVFSLYKPIAEGDQAKMHTLIWLYRRIYAWLGLVVFVLGMILMPFLPDIATGSEAIEHVYWIYFITLSSTVVSYYFSYNSTLFSATQREYVLTYFAQIFKFVNLGVSVAILLIFQSYLALCIAGFLVALCDRIMVYFLARRNWPWLSTKPENKLSESEKREIVKNVKAMFCHKIGDYCINGTSSLIIGKFVNIAAVGLFTNYLTLLNAVKPVATACFGNMTAGIGNLVATSSRERVHEVFQEVNFLSCAIFGLISVGFCVCANNIVAVWLGEQYVLDFAVIALIATDLYLYGMRQAPFIFRNGAGLFYNDRISPLIQAVTNLAVGLVMVQYWGMAGVFFGTVVSGLAAPCWIRPYVLYRDYFGLPFRRYIDRYLVYLLPSLVSGTAAVVLFDRYWQLPLDWAGLAVRMLGVMVLFIVCFVLIACFLPERKLLISRYQSIHNHLCRRFLRKDS